MKSFSSFVCTIIFTNQLLLTVGGNRRQRGRIFFYLNLYLHVITILVKIIFNLNETTNQKRKHIHLLCNYVYILFLWKINDRKILIYVSLLADLNPFRGKHCTYILGEESSCSQVNNLDEEECTNRLKKKVFIQIII